MQSSPLVCWPQILREACHAIQLEAHFFLTAFSGIASVLDGTNRAVG